MAAEQLGLTFAVVLRRLRDDAHLTQEELAEAAQLSPRSVSDLERGIHRTARRTTAELLAEALNLAGPAQALFVAAALGLRPAADVLVAKSGGGIITAAAPPNSALAEADYGSDARASNLAWLDVVASTRFVGRDRDLGVLRDGWSTATAGHRVLALVAGEPGVGKTALATELARIVHADGGLVLYGRWSEELLAPYQALREALGDYARACPDPVLRRDVGDLGEIARLCPEVAQWTGVFADPSFGAAEAERFRLFESLDMWLQRMAARRPVLLVLDDLHWADRPSLLLLMHLMQARRPTPILAVAMYRDVDLDRSELAAVLPSLARDTDCRRVAVRGLEREAIAALLEAAVGHAVGERDGELVQELQRQTAGNAFYLLEIIRHISERGGFVRGVLRLGQ
ncbi:MAG TPA: AAA family ATPase, partial [Gemmataceae bacterium]|nr:AAA family ATPase [Gemmataceae bacterium]